MVKVSYQKRLQDALYSLGTLETLLGLCGYIFLCEVV